MAQQTDIYKELGILAGMFKFIDQHKTLSNIILFLEALAALYAVITYNFTTNI